METFCMLKLLQLKQSMVNQNMPRELSLSVKDEPHKHREYHYFGPSEVRALPLGFSGKHTGH